MATKIIITFDTIPDACEYISEKLIAKGKKFKYRPVGIMGTPEVEVEPTDNELGDLLRRKDPKPEVEYICGTCDHWSVVSGCTKYMHTATRLNTCVNHALNGKKNGEYKEVVSSNRRNGEIYLVRHFPDGTAACSCPAFRFRVEDRPCKHILRRPWEWQ